MSYLFPDAKDTEILTCIAILGEATYYELFPHGKTTRKARIRNITPAGGLYKLKRLEKAGYLTSSKETKDRREKQPYKLTVKGFMYLLAFDKDLQMIVNSQGSKFQYRTVKPAGSFPITKQGPLKKMFPLQYHEDFRRAFGDNLYFESLRIAAQKAYGQIMYAFNQKIVWEGHKLPLVLREPGLSMKWQGIICDFEIDFLEKMFPGRLPKTQNTLHSPSSDLLKAIKSRLDETMWGLKHRAKWIRSIQTDARLIFGPSRTESGNQFILRSHATKRSVR